MYKGTVESKPCTDWAFLTGQSSAGNFLAHGMQTGCKERLSLCEDFQYIDKSLPVYLHLCRHSSPHSIKLCTSPALRRRTDQRDPEFTSNLSYPVNIMKSGLSTEVELDFDLIASLILF